MGDHLAALKDGEAGPIPGMGEAAADLPHELDIPLVALEGIVGTGDDLRPGIVLAEIDICQSDGLRLMGNLRDALFVRSALQPVDLCGPT